ncbi:MAG: ABC transporter permease subunit, partial [Beijerinckiaceae bacterium]
MTFCVLLRRLWLALVLSLAALAPAAAQQLGEEAITRFLADSFGDTEAAIAATASSGAPHAAAVLQALADRRLFASASARAVYWTDAAGKSFDARTGQAADAPADAAPVRLNNRLRGIVQAALGSLTLMSPDPAQRLRAAAAVFRSRDVSALPALAEAIRKETNPRIRRALEEAQAAAILADTSQPEAIRMSAAATIADGADQDNLALLRQFQPQATGPLKTIIDQGVASIERSLQIRQVGQTVWFGVSLGSVLLLAAIGLAITFGVMGVINMAHGEMVMIGAYVTFVTQEFFRARYPGLLDWSL